MNNRLNYILGVIATLMMVSCDETGDQIVAKDMDVPAGYALSAGTSTVFV